MPDWAKTPEGLRLAFDALGPIDLPPLLLLHGAGQTRHSWKGGMQAFADAGFHVVAADARGHGESDRAPDGDYGFDAFKRDLAALTSTLREPPVVIGASMGGLTAIMAAGEAPRVPIRALVLVDITVRLAPAGSARVVEFLGAHLDGFASFEEAADAIARYNPNRKRPPSADGLAQVLRLRGDRYHWHWDPRLLAAMDEPPFDEDRMIAAAAAVDVPTLLVRAGASDLVGPEELRHMLEIMPGARAVDVAGAGHMMAGDRNDAFVGAILPFLQELRT